MQRFGFKTMGFGFQTMRFGFKTMGLSESGLPNKIPSIYQCHSEGREKHTIVADMDGTLLVGWSAFPYFALVAYDVGGVFRLLLLLVASPLAKLLYDLVSESVGIHVLIFATFAGAKVDAIKSAAKVVLPKHYSEDVHPETWRVFSSCGRKCVLTATPRVMVEPFLKDYLGVDIVFGTEILSYKGFATGLVASPGVLVGQNKATILKKFIGFESTPDIGLGDRKSDFPFMRLCKEMYIVPWRPNVEPVRRDALPKPVIFHDGRLVQRPTPLMALLIILWFPVAIPLSILRLFVSKVVPKSSVRKTLRLLGCTLTIKGTDPFDAKHSCAERKGLLFVCCHKNSLDVPMVSFCIDCVMITITYGVPNFVEFISPIKCIRVSRDRTKDTKLIQDILNRKECLVMCPEGTTCREPYLLRFSKLFAEITDQIVPVAISVKQNLFYATTVRGCKWLDPFFYFMNPTPSYEITFLDKLPPDQTCSGGKSSQEVANNVQQMIAKAANYTCTNLTRKDKYQVLAGTDGLVRQKAVQPGLKVE